MNLFLTTAWINPEIVQALCWTLLHSIWQGLVMALVAGVLLMATRKSSSALRYNLLTALLFLFLGVVVFTLVGELREAAATIDMSSFTLSSQQAETLSGGAALPPATPSDWLGDLDGFLSRNATWIVGLWLVVMGIKLGQIVAGFSYMHHIRHRRTRQVPQEWREKLDGLAARMGIRRTIEFFESHLIQVPMVFGYFKPVVLVPIGFLTGLPEEQVEQIIRHELAHIRRRDFLVNLLQAFIEMFFFFNPSVLWISTLIREEREHCCDDLAIDGSNDHMNYVQALVSFQEYRLSMPATALGFAGSRSPMLDRIRRIVNKNNKKLNLMERTFLIVGIVIITTLALLPGSKLLAQNTRSEVTIDRLMITDGAKRTRLVEARDDKGNRYHIVTVNKVITEFHLNDKKMPVEAAFDHKDIIARIDEKIVSDQEAENLKAAELARQQEKDWNAARDRGLAEQKLEREQAEARKRQEEQDWNAARDRGLAEQKREREQAEARKREDERGWNAARQEGLRQDSIERAHRKARDEQDARDLEYGRAEANRMRLYEAENARLYGERVKSIAASLVSEGVVSQVSRIESFSLGHGKLVVNGQQQSEELYNRLKAKYLTANNSYISYNKDDN